jgi:LCP family protein required for cell wall assembly
MEQKINTLQSSKKQTRHLRKGRVAILVTILIFLVLGVAYALLGGVSSTSTLANTFSMQERINILVLGVDAREEDVGRSDTAFVVTIDTNAKKVTMLSIPRDSRVKIDGHGWDKINHAYAFGGSKLSKSSVENLLGIPIDYTVVMNFQGFVRMIDALGGVTIDVDKRMYYSDPYDDDGGLYIDLHPGVQKLNGKLAIEYVRYRDEEGDIGRVSRQQKFLKALLQEFAKPQLITKLPELIKEFAAAVKTDMPTKEMVKLIPLINEAAKSGLHTEWVSGTPCWIQDVSYWLPNIKELRAKVAEIQGITVDGRYTQGTERLEREYASSVPREIKITESSPAAIQKDLNIDKQTTDSAKTIAPKSSATIISIDNKPKSTSIPASRQDLSDPKITKNMDIHSDEAAGSSTEGGNKNTVTITKSKQ